VWALQGSCLNRTEQKRATPETNQGVPSMSKSMETNTAAIYLRESTEDDGKSYLWDEDDTTWVEVEIPTE
jgi:hypothetical protein